MAKNKTGWQCVLTLDALRRPVAGSADALCDAIRRGADLRIATEFRHNEHIDMDSQNSDLICEVAEFRVTYLLEGRWTAGIMTLRQPISLPDGFGPRPSMSFFLYNQDGQQAIARPYFDGASVEGAPGSSPLQDHRHMPKYHEQDRWDDATNAPNSNFVYEFDVYQFFVLDEWQEVLSHSADGTVISGSIERLAREFACGREVKVAIRGLCGDWTETSSLSMDHEVFVQTGSCYYYTQHRLFIAGSHPIVRVKPAIPLRYTTEGWDFGWLLVRTDGLVVCRLVDPYTLKFRKSEGKCSIRWFVR
jgi:hypothetical protein